MNLRIPTPENQILGLTAYDGLLQMQRPSVLKGDDLDQRILELLQRRNYSKRDIAKLVGVDVDYVFQLDKRLY